MNGLKEKELKLVDNLKEYYEQLKLQVPDTVPEPRFFATDYESKELGNNAASIATKRRPLRLLPVLVKGMAVAVIFSAVLGISSPAFANWVKEIPGVAGNWLSSIRESDGVKNAVVNGYVPIEPVTIQKDGATFTIADIYMTQERMSFRVLVHSDHLEKYQYPNQIVAKIEGLIPSFATNTERDASENADKNSDVIELAYQINLEDEQVKQFLAHNPKELSIQLERIDHVKAVEAGKDPAPEAVISASIPFNRANLLKDKMITVNTPIKLAPNDPDLNDLILKQVQVSPTGLKAFLAGKSGISVDVPWKNGEPYFVDDRGTTYHYLWDLDHMEKNQGVSVIPFASSPYFDKNVKTMQLHLPMVIISEEKPSAQFKLSLNDKFPLTVPYKDRTITIESAKYENGFLHLKVKQNDVVKGDQQTVLMQVDGYNLKIAKDSSLQIYYRDRDRQKMFKEQAFQKGVEDELFIYAPKQEEYQITLRRYMDSLQLNKTVDVSLQ
jgi:hypothetical protein